MLPLPNLDDRSFEQLVQEARSSIPKLLPEWTDENAHDPGITFIELFAWLSEMQQYYADRVTVRNKLKFLKLLGIQLQKARAAKAYVTFNDAAEPIKLPKGLKLLAADQHFETTEAMTYIPVKIDRIVVRTETEANDYTSSNEHIGVSYYAFGHDAKEGNRLYIAFDRELPEHTEIALTFKLFDDYPIQQGAYRTPIAGVIPSATVSWKFYGSADAETRSATWQPLQIVRDETLHMSYSGRLIFKVNGAMRPVMIHPANDRGRFWVCCTIEHGGYELSPKIEKASLNTVQAIQRNTLSEFAEFDGLDEPGQTIRLSTYLAYYGDIRVQVREENGLWRYWQQLDGETAGQTTDGGTPGYYVEKDAETRTVTLRFGDGRHGRVAQTGTGNIRVICSSPDFSGRRIVGSSTGLPHQTYKMYDYPSPMYDMRLQIGRNIEGETDPLWEDWLRVDNFDGSEPNDPHYVYDPQTMELKFGDNERGRVAKRSVTDNIWIISCRHSSGMRGNVTRHLIDTIDDESGDFAALSATNHFFASGGAEKETMDEAIDRARKQLHEPYRAVTNDDYETIVRQTPGLRIARVKAIPLFTVGLKDYPHNKAAGQMTVVVVPYGESKTPMPSPGFLQTVKNHLNERRLITTEVHVIPPEYVKVTAHAVVVVEPYYVDEAAQVVAALNALLQPFDRKDGTTGWTFGRTVYKGDIYDTISRLPGVCYVQDLWLDAEGRHIQKTVSGDVQIPPYGLVYSGQHEIELISRMHV